MVRLSGKLMQRWYGLRARLSSRKATGLEHIQTLAPNQLQFIAALVYGRASTYVRK
jgi:hypothetical protein